jgi:hypothetical protein
MKTNMIYRKNAEFILKFILVAALAYILCIFPNLLIDPQSIFRKNFDINLPVEPNRHFIKMRYLLTNKNSYNYDSFVFGSSTTGHINPLKIPNGIFYNMAYSEGVPSEFLEDLKILIKSGVKIKQLIIGISDISYKIDPESHLEQFMRHPYDSSRAKRLFFYLRYISSPVSVQRKAYIEIIKNSKIRKYGMEFSQFYDMYGTGMHHVLGLDDFIEKNRNKYCAQGTFTSPRIYQYQGRIDKTIEELREIITISKTHNIGVTLFIEPIHYISYLNTDPELFFDFKEKLSRLTDYYDFSGLNSVTFDNYYFYETSHYRPLVGDMIISRIFNVNLDKIPKDFGVLVSKGNIELHIARQKEELRQVKIKQ